MVWASEVDLMGDIKANLNRKLDDSSRSGMKLKLQEHILVK